METLELIKRARSGDKLAREQVIEENMGLVYSIVKRFVGRGYDSEELSQIGAIGLIKAVDKFDLRFDVRFSTYAVPLITGEIKRFLRDDGMVRVSRAARASSPAAASKKIAGASSGWRPNFRRNWSANPRWMNCRQQSNFR